MTSADPHWENPLDDYLDALAAATPPATGDLDLPMQEVVKRFFDSDDAPAPRDGRAAQIWEELMNQPAYADSRLSTPTIFDVPSQNGRLSPPAAPMPIAHVRPGRSFPRWRFAQLAVAALLLVAIGFGFRALDPFGPGAEQPSSIPAAVAPLASPAATPFPRAHHPIIGAWLIDMEPWNPGHNVHYVIFDADGTFTAYEDFSGVSIGTWRATGERTAELVFVAQHPTSLDTFEPAFEVPVSMLEGNPLTSWMSFEVDESGNSFTASGYYEPRNTSGDVVVHFEYADESPGDPIVTGTRLAPIEQSAEASVTP